MADPQPGLTWGLKTSFLRYLFSTDGGSHSAIGVTLDEDGRYHWPLASITATDDTVSIACSGSLHLVGHGGALSIRLRDPAVVVSPAGTALTVDDPDLPGARLTLALLADMGDPGIPAEGWRGLAARLSGNGALLFNAVYPEGEPLEPVDVVLVRATAVHSARESTDPGAQC